jgi:hypothetical protein
LTDQRLRKEYALLLGGRRAGAREECASLEAIDALVARQGPETERLATMDHVMACPPCRAEFEQLRALRAAHDRPAHTRRQLLMAAASVAVVIGAGLLWRVRPHPALEVYRGGSEGVTVVSPIGATPPQGTLSFVWHSVAGAATYHLELVDADGGTVLLTASITDTVFALPDSVSLEPGRAYAWWVQANGPDGLQARTPAVRFTLSNP